MDGAHLKGRGGGIYQAKLQRPSCDMVIVRPLIKQRKGTLDRIIKWNPLLSLSATPLPPTLTPPISNPLSQISQYNSRATQFIQKLGVLGTWSVYVKRKPIYFLFCWSKNERQVPTVKSYTRLNLKDPVGRPNCNYIRS